jgi:hypothetical protein
MFQSLLGPARFDERLTKIGAGQGERWIEADRHTKRVESFVLPAQLPQQSAEVVPGQGEVSPGIEGRAKLVFGLGMSPQSVQGQTQVIGRFGIAGLEAQGRATRFDRPIVVAQAAVSLGQVGVECGRLRPQGRSPADQLDGSAAVAALMMHDAEKVQGFGVLRLTSQDFMVATRRIRVAARLVQLERGGQVRIHADFAPNLAPGIRSPLKTRLIPGALL